MEEEAKIHQLLASNQEEHTQLAIELMRGLQLDFGPYEALVDWFQKEQQTNYPFEKALQLLFSKAGQWLRQPNALAELPLALSFLPKMRNLTFFRTPSAEINPILWEMRALTTLRMVSSAIKKLPKEIGQLSNLEHLDLEDNELNELPEAIGKLEKLERLNIGKNPILSLPPEIKNLKNLKKISLTANGLSKEMIEVLPIWLPNCEIHHIPF